MKKKIINKGEDWNKLYKLMYKMSGTVYCFLSYTIAGTMARWKEFEKSKEHIHNSGAVRKAERYMNEFFQFIEKNNVSDELYEDVYWYIHRKKYNFYGYGKNRRKGAPYSKTDNRHIRVGNGGHYSGKVRFPSKKRKYRWKRFIKLFPEFEGVYNKLFK